MIPTHLSVAIIRPGTKVDFAPLGDPTSVRAACTHWANQIHHIVDNTWFETAIMAFLPDSKAVIIPDCEDPELSSLLKVVDGVTTVPIFVVLSLTDQADIDIGTSTRGSWLAEYMQEGNWDDLNVPNLEAIHAATLSLINKHDDIRFESPHGLTTANDQIVYVEFLSFWEVCTSRDWETGIEEIDSLTFIGVAKTVLDPSYADNAIVVPADINREKGKL